MRRHGLGPFDGVALGLGLAFLYAPILAVVVYSFNRSRSLGVWGGFSTTAYAALLHDDVLLSAALVSLGVALVSATIATCLGTLAALSLTGPGTGSGRLALTALLATPTVLPDVITGLSLLLLFVAVGLERGFWTVVIAHATLTIPFAAVVVQSRLVSFDRRLAEAARDLGATSPVAFLTVTLPVIAPAVAAAFLLAMSLSLDDVVLASFTAGPGSTTLPMRIYGSVRLGVSPEINAASTVMITAATLIVATSTLLLRRGPRER